MKSNFIIPLILTIILVLTSFMPMLHYLIYLGDLSILAITKPENNALYNWLINFPLIIGLILVFVKSRNIFLSNTAGLLALCILLVFIYILGGNYFNRDPFFGALVGSALSGSTVSFIGYKKYKLSLKIDPPPRDYH